MAKSRSKTAPSLSKQVEKALYSGLSKLGITPDDVAREHRALKKNLEKLDAAAGRALQRVGEELEALRRSVRDQAGKRGKARAEPATRTGDKPKQKRSRKTSTK